MVVRRLDEELKQGLLCMETVFCLVPRHGARIVEQVEADFFATVGWQAVHEFHPGIARGLHHLRVDLVGQQLLDALVPGLHRFAHGDPDIGMNEVHALDCFFRVFGDGDPCTALGGEGLALVAGVVETPSFLFALELMNTTNMMSLQPAALVEKYVADNKLSFPQAQFEEQYKKFQDAKALDAGSYEQWLLDNGIEIDSAVADGAQSLIRWERTGNNANVDGDCVNSWIIDRFHLSARAYQLAEHGLL